MDAIKVAKVERVQCNKPTVQGDGTLHLTAHHLIFIYEDHASEKEMWVPYPLISLVTRLPQTLQGLSPLAFRCRTFETFTLSFRKDPEATDVFESVRELTVITSIRQLYAFFYQPAPPFTATGGWDVYSPRAEYTRMGVGSRTKAWRFTDLNQDYSLCPTYPAQLVVPTRISDAVLTYAVKYRSKARFPALAYLHWANTGSITRSSQPLIGLTNNRSIQDEKLVQSIFQTHLKHVDTLAPVYGATTTNLIVDARSTTNAVANAARGAGTENMEYYKEAKKVYLGVDNIHTMRDSLSKIVDALQDADTLSAMISPEIMAERAPGLLDRQALRRSGWLRHLGALLHGALVVVRNVHVNSSHVLVHCSDGWDRTTQVVSLAEVCLDPYYRTLRGFQVLIEKDWASFGHKFGERSGHLSSEKFFVSPAAPDPGSRGGGEAAQAAQAFLASVQNKFVAAPHLKETSPVFHQFLECVRQVQRQFPERFEFNELYLRKLYHHLYSCQFGTFLFDCERERRMGEGAPLRDCTHSVWDWVNSSPQKESFLNPDYDASLDDRSSRVSAADMGVLIFDPKQVRFWHELYGRGDEEMNGRIHVPQPFNADATAATDGPEDEPSSTALTPLSSPSSNAIALPEVASLSVQPNPTSNPGSPPAAAPPRPETSRVESFRPFQSTNSNFSLRSPNSPELPSSSSRPPRRGPAEGFSASGMKSMWAQLSSNAAAALSVAQEAYEGVAKDLRGPGGAGSGSGGSREQGGELLSPDTWGAPSAAAAAATAPPRVNTVLSAGGMSSSFSEANPWSATTTTPTSSLSADFSKVRTPSLGSGWEIPGEIGSSSYAFVPNPNSNSNSTRRSSTDLQTSSFPGRTIRANSASSAVPTMKSDVSTPSSTVKRNEPAKPGKEVDPLGVGFL